MIKNNKTETPDYLFNEDETIENIREFVDGSYSLHYAHKPELQTASVWEALGSLDTTSRDVAIKYLMRYGKKNGKNVKDLYKAIHYIIMMIYDHEQKQQKESV